MDGMETKEKEGGRMEEGRELAVGSGQRNAKEGKVMVLKALPPVPVGIAS